MRPSWCAGVHNMAEHTESTTGLAALRSAIDGVHHDVAYRVGAIAQAAFRLAQHQALHADVTAVMKLQPAIGASLKGFGVVWGEPVSEDKHALPELLRELCEQITDVASRIERLAIAPAADVAQAGGANHG